MTRQERNSFVESNLGLVHHWLRKYSSLPYYEDLVQHALIGLIEALDRTEGNINQGYLKRYVCGKAINYINKGESLVYKINPGKGTYERIECNSLDMPISTEEDSITFGDTIVDECDIYEDIITAIDFENYINSSKVKYKENLMLFLEGYDRTEIAKDAGVTYETLRQQLKKLHKAAFV